MAGYSGTPLYKKLGLTVGGRLALLGAPRCWSVPELPDRARSSRRKPASLAASTKEDVAVAFYRGRSELETDLPRLAEAIFPDGALWIAWPRRAAGHESDIREHDIRALALPLGLVDVKVAALDEDWSGLRLVWRRERRRT